MAGDLKTHSKIVARVSRVAPRASIPGEMAFGSSMPLEPITLTAYSVKAEPRASHAKPDGSASLLKGEILSK